MKKNFLIGLGLTFCSLSAFAQTETKVIGNVTIQYPGSKGSTYSPQNGVSINFANNNGMNINNANTNNNANAGIDMSGLGNGIGNGAPDLSEIQAQSMATAQALKNSSANAETAINLQTPPEGAAEILKSGTKALQVNNEKEINQLPKQALNDKNNQGLETQKFNQLTTSAVVHKSTNKTEVVSADISAWNKTTINKFEEEGKLRTEERYKEFLLKK